MLKLAAISQFSPSFEWNFDEKPFLVFWETTKACWLQCKHCRANSIRNPLPNELSTGEGYRLIDELVKFGKPYPVLVFTGGDPLLRNDILDLVAYSYNWEMRTSLAPSVTSLLTEDFLARLRKIGPITISFSLDGAKPETHDGLRGVAGTWDLTLKMIRKAVKLGFRVQVNSTVLRRNVLEFADIFQLVEDLGASSWEVFFLVQTGRGTELEDLTAQEWEDFGNFLFEASKYGIAVRTTEGPQYRRIILERTSEAYPKKRGRLFTQLTDRLHLLAGNSDANSTSKIIPTRDGKGILFIGYDGTVYPSGFLPIPVGSVRKSEIKEIYTKDALLVELRNSSLLKGRCGTCRYRDICGGSRARAYAYFWDPFQEDPACAYDTTSS